MILAKLSFKEGTIVAWRPKSVAKETHILLHHILWVGLPSIFLEHLRRAAVRVRGRVSKSASIVG